MVRPLTPLPPPQKKIVQIRFGYFKTKKIIKKKITMTTKLRGRAKGQRTFLAQPLKKNFFAASQTRINRHVWNNWTQMWETRLGINHKGIGSTELETLVVDLVVIYGNIFKVAIYSSKLHENFSPLFLNRPKLPNLNQIALKI